MKHLVHPLDRGEYEKYATQLEKMTRQLESWGAGAPSVRPSVHELKVFGLFADFDKLIARTLPHIKAAVAAFEEAPSVANALSLRDAAALSMTAGDGCGGRAFQHRCRLRRRSTTNAAVDDHGG